MNTVTLEEYRKGIRPHLTAEQRFDDVDELSRTERPNVRRPALGAKRLG